MVIRASSPSQVSRLRGKSLCVHALRWEPIPAAHKCGLRRPLPLHSGQKAAPTAAIPRVVHADPRLRSPRSTERQAVLPQVHVVTTFDLERLIAQAPPGSTVVVISIPPAIGVAAAPASPEASRRDRASQPALGGTDPAGSGAEDGSALGIARALQNDSPTLALKPSEWAVRVGVTGRELRRAVEYGTIPSRLRGTGKGHGAQVIEVSAIVEYLELRAAIAAGTASRPAWYEHVVRGRHAA